MINIGFITQLSKQNISFELYSQLIISENEITKILSIESSNVTKNEILVSC